MEQNRKTNDASVVVVVVVDVVVDAVVVVVAAAAFRGGQSKSPSGRMQWVTVQSPSHVLYSRPSGGTVKLRKALRRRGKRAPRAAKTCSEPRPVGRRVALAAWAGGKHASPAWVPAAAGAGLRAKCGYSGPHSWTEGSGRRAQGGPACGAIDIAVGSKE